MDDGSDGAVVAAVLGGNPDAFATLLHRYRDAYARYAVRMLGNREDAEDALQLAFVRAYRGLGRCRDPERFAPWLFQIVVNECRTVGARRGRREKKFVQDEFELARALTEHPADQAGLREEIQFALDQLDASQREAFVLKHVEDLSYEEMAKITGVGESALKMRVKRACDRLRELLEGANHE